MVFKKIREKLTSAKENVPANLGRNDLCHCGSGKKYKKCHFSQDEETARKNLPKIEVPKLDSETQKSEDKSTQGKHSKTRPPAARPSKVGGFMRSIVNRKTGES